MRSLTTTLARRALAAALLPWLAAAAAAEVAVTHVANEGFLLAAGDRKVLVDALFDDGIVGYGRIPDELRPALEGGGKPFDGVDLVLATHFHRDHFAAGAVARFLAANPRALFVSTEQAVAALAEVDGVDASRVRAVVPAEGERRRVAHAGIEVEILNLHHGRDRNPPVQNLGFLIHLGGLTILHVGDTEATLPDFRPYELGRDAIDLALLPSWFLADDMWREVVRGEIRPRWIGLMHLATPDAPSSWFSSAGSYDEMIAQIRAFAPEARIFTRALDRQPYPPTD